MVGSSRRVVDVYHELHRKAGTTSDTTGSRKTFDSVVAASAEDPLARESIEQVSDNLGRGLVVLVNLINPGVVVVGGQLMNAQHIVLPRLQEIIQDEALARADVEIVASTHRADAPLIGTATLAFDRMFSDPTRNWIR